MYSSKQTDLKLRWDSYVDRVLFELYIPKWRVPRPWPKEHHRLDLDSGPPNRRSFESWFSDKLEVRSLSEHTGKAGPLAEPGPQFDFNRADYFAAFTLRVRPAF